MGLVSAYYGPFECLLWVLRGHTMGFVRAHCRPCECLLWTLLGLVRAYYGTIQNNEDTSFKLENGLQLFCHGQDPKDRP